MSDFKQPNISHESKTFIESNALINHDVTLAHNFFIFTISKLNDY